MNKYWIHSKKEKLQMWIVWKLPRWLIYWATIRLLSNATTGKYSTTIVPELTAVDALKRWGAKEEWEQSNE